MKVINNSGGRTSGMMTYMMLDKMNSQDEIIFTNTGDETEATYRFLHEQEKFFDRQFTWIEYDYPKGFIDTGVLKKPATLRTIIEAKSISEIYDLDLLHSFGKKYESIKTSSVSIGGMFGKTKTTKVKNVNNERKIEADWRNYFTGGGVLERQIKKVDFNTAARTLNKNGDLNLDEESPFIKMFFYANSFRMAKCICGIVPNPVQRFCTGNLKIRTVKAYMKSKGIDFYDSYLGIRKDEPDRYFKLKDSDDKMFDTFFPLWRANVIKSDVREFWKEQYFDLGTSELFTNFRGCFEKKKYSLALIFKQEPNSAVLYHHMERLVNNIMSRGNGSVKSLVELGNSLSEQTLKILDAQDTSRGIGCFCAD